MEFFLFLLYNQESSREKYFPAKRGEINMKGTSCEFCANYTYDEECDEYYCDINLAGYFCNVRLYITLVFVREALRNLCTSAR